MAFFKRWGDAELAVFQKPSFVIADSSADKHHVLVDLELSGPFAQYTLKWAVSDDDHGHQT